MKKKKILIIGFGNMGLSHFNSFCRKKYIIHIVENKFNENIKKIIKNKQFNKYIYIFKKIPSKQKYLLTISATGSIERFGLIKNFLKKNKTKFLLLEKFSFLKIKHFEEFNKKFSNKTKTFVNSWAYILAKKMNFPTKIKRFDLTCYIREGLLLANITHIFHLFSFLNNKSTTQKLYNNNCKIIKNVKRKLYDELKGTVEVEHLNKNKLIIKTKKKMNDLIIFSIYAKNLSINYRLCITKNNMVHYYKSGKKIKEINFPYSSITSLIFLKKALNNDNKYMPSFQKDYEISKLILNKFKVKIP
jgi:hypothetical protein